ncbi:Trp biosynthesis-associated membrane protein [Nocardioides dongkuii]|uniref:Trp biosynthesis-associated membrane protein n=1 Tax=Nocardioides dongkuii TaxID=2760089 RepID=UPI0015F8D19E|nr:Trp biosynthesis-associated membrane protein [Nocardioides dongkuii]
MGGRRSFGPVVLLGLGSGALAAVAGSKPWAAVQGGRAATTITGGDAGEMPLAGALALVVLACWGVLLVTRGRVRRAVAVLAAVAAVGTLVTVAVGWSQAADQLREDVVLLEGTLEVAHTGWWWAALVGSVLSLVASVLAARLVPQWPEMGRRYDAPADAAAAPAAAQPDADAGDRSSLDLWRALDEGHDPTA